LYSKVNWRPADNSTTFQDRSHSLATDLQALDAALPVTQPETSRNATPGLAVWSVGRLVRHPHEDLAVVLPKAVSLHRAVDLSEELVVDLHDQVSGRIPRIPLS
jgi:hypothetical protein